jgi:S-formylglutathione hydrolase FrmB
MVYLPPGYDEDSSRRYPTVYVLQGYTGHVEMWKNRTPFRQPYLETADQAFASGAALPTIVVYVDAWTKFGGSQFVDSPGTGRYHSYLCDDVVSFVDREYRTLTRPEHRGVQGKSSGGFGAMITPMLRPDLFGALATHAGDSLYELSYIHEFGTCARYLRAYGGDIWAWWDDFNERPAFTKTCDSSLLSMLGVAACFSADPDGTIRLPFETTTGRIIPEIWSRWLEWDPLNMVDRYREALIGLRGVWIDAGDRDEWMLDLGAQAFRDALLQIGVTDLHFEIFDATHAAIDYRYPLSLTYLSHRLAFE